MEGLTSGPNVRYGTIVFREIPREGVVYKVSFLVTFLGEAFDKFGMHLETRPEASEFARAYAGLVEELLDRRKLRLHIVEVCAGELQGIDDEGVGLMNDGKVSGCKLVFRIADTS